MNTNQLTISEVVPTYRNPITTRFPIRTSDAVAEAFRKVIDVNTQKEHFIVFHLDGNHQIINYNIAAVGTANSCPIHPRDVFQPAILNGSVSIVVTHNHPSGNLEASREDINVTERLVKAGDILGIKILDHVIVTHEENYSLRENNACKF